MGAALLSLGGVLLSIYLYLYKLGLVGLIACGGGAGGTGSACEAVQLGPYSRVLGIDVPLIGLLGYLAMLLTALVGLQPGPAARGWPQRWMVGLSGLGVAFTLYLKYLEFFVIHQVCRWCVASAILITLIFVLSLLDLRRRAPSSPS